MGKTCKFFIFIAFGLLQVVGCTGSEKYKIVISDKKGNKEVVCLFTGKDANKDGHIELSELTSFEETGPNIYTPAYGLNKGWQKDVAIEDIPPISHKLKDIEKFKFSVKAFGKGNPVLKYSTRTKEMTKIGDYYFWRSVEITEDGKKYGIFSGVSDGTKGLEIGMHSTEDYTMKVELY